MSRRETAIRVRPAIQDDLGLLWDFLAIAAYEPDVDAAKAVPFVAAHLAGWRRPEDFGFIAELDGVAIGAAWARQFSPDEQPAFHVDERTAGRSYDAGALKLAPTAESGVTAAHTSAFITVDVR